MAAYRSYNKFLDSVDEIEKKYGGISEENDDIVCLDTLWIEKRSGVIDSLQTADKDAWFSVLESVSDYSDLDGSSTDDDHDSDDYQEASNKNSTARHKHRSTMKEVRVELTDVLLYMLDSEISADSLEQHVRKKNQTPKNAEVEHSSPKKRLNRRFVDQRSQSAHKRRRIEKKENSYAISSSDLESDADLYSSYQIPNYTKCFESDEETFCEDDGLMKRNTDRVRQHAEISDEDEERLPHIHNLTSDESMNRSINRKRTYRESLEEDQMIHRHHNRSSHQTPKTPTRNSAEQHRTSSLKMKQGYIHDRHRKLSPRVIKSQRIGRSHTHPVYAQLQESIESAEQRLDLYGLNTSDLTISGHCSTSHQTSSPKIYEQSRLNSLHQLPSKRRESDIHSRHKKLSPHVIKSQYVSPVYTKLKESIRSAEQRLRLYAPADLTLSGPSSTSHQTSYSHQENLTPYRHSMNSRAMLEEHVNPINRTIQSADNNISIQSYHSKRQIYGDYYKNELPGSNLTDSVLSINYICENRYKINDDHIPHLKPSSIKETYCLPDSRTPNALYPKRYQEGPSGDLSTIISVQPTPHFTTQIPNKDHHKEKHEATTPKHYHHGVLDERIRLSSIKRRSEPRREFSPLGYAAHNDNANYESASTVSGEYAKPRLSSGYDEVFTPMHTRKIE